MEFYLIPLIWGKSSVLIGLDRVPSNLHLMKFEHKWTGCYPLQRQLLSDDPPESCHDHKQFRRQELGCFIRSF
jgi:hypothetical protein